MSGSSRAGRTLSRCVIILDAGIYISWEMNPDGSNPGVKHHQEEQESFKQRIDARTPAIEVLFDELEKTGHRFMSPADPAFADYLPQMASSGQIERVEVQLNCEPLLTETELDTLAKKIGSLLLPPPVLPHLYDYNDPFDQTKIVDHGPWPENSEEFIVDQALREHGDLGSYGDLRAGLEALLPENWVRITVVPQGLQVDVIPIGGHGNELQFLVKKTWAIVNVVK